MIIIRSDGTATCVTVTVQILVDSRDFESHGGIVVAVNTDRMKLDV